jgi:hypothetical protein
MHCTNPEAHLRRFLAWMSRLNLVALMRVVLAVRASPRC